MPLPSEGRKHKKMSKSKTVQISNADYTLEIFEDGTIGVHLHSGDIDGQNLRFYGGYITVKPAENSKFGEGYINIPLEAHSRYENGKDITIEPLVYREDINAAKEQLRASVGILKGIPLNYDKDERPDWWPDAWPWHGELSNQTKREMN